MTKIELAKALSERNGINLQEAVKAVEGVMDILKDSIAKRDNIYLRGLGTFAIVERKGKTARNIKAGTQIVVPRHHIIKFKPSKELKEKVF